MGLVLRSKIKWVNLNLLYLKYIFLFTPLSATSSPENNNSSLLKCKIRWRFAIGFSNCWWYCNSCKCVFREENWHSSEWRKSTHPITIVTILFKLSAGHNVCYESWLVFFWYLGGVILTIPIFKTMLKYLFTFLLSLFSLNVKTDTDPLRGFKLPIGLHKLNIHIHHLLCVYTLQMWLTGPEVDNIVFVKTDLSLKIFFSFILIIWEITYLTDFNRHDNVDVRCIIAWRSQRIKSYVFIFFCFSFL